MPVFVKSKVSTLTDSNIKGSIWVENTRALVRPIMAYSFMALFIAVEVTAFITLVDAGLGAGDALNKIWDDRVIGSMGLYLNFLLRRTSVQ